jgi:hypothetical protein
VPRDGRRQGRDDRGPLSKAPRRRAGDLRVTVNQREAGAALPLRRAAVLDPRDPAVPWRVKSRRTGGPLGKSAGISGSRPDIQGYARSVPEKEKMKVPEDLEQRQAGGDLEGLALGFARFRGACGLDRLVAFSYREAVASRSREYFLSSR